MTTAYVAARAELVGRIATATGRRVTVDPGAVGPDSVLVALESGARRTSQAAGASWRVWVVGAAGDEVGLLDAVAAVQSALPGLAGFTRQPWETAAGDLPAFVFTVDGSVDLVPEEG
jgi:hypothetical protein